MTAVAGIFGGLFFICVALAVVSLFKPGAAFFLKQPGKGKAMLSWLGIAVVCAVIGGTLTPAPPNAQEPAQAAAPAPAKRPQAEAAPALKDVPEPFVWTEEQEKERQAAINKMAAASAPVQAELKTLYNELLAMRGTSAFRDYGFSAKNRQASVWNDKVKALQARMENASEVAVEVRAAPGYLLGLGLIKEWRSGGETDMSKWDEEMVNAGINWKPAE